MSVRVSVLTLLGGGAALVAVACCPKPGPGAGTTPVARACPACPRVEPTRAAAPRGKACPKTMQGKEVERIWDAARAAAMTAAQLAARTLDWRKRRPRKPTRGVKKKVFDFEGDDLAASPLEPRWKPQDPKSKAAVAYLGAYKSYARGAHGTAAKQLAAAYQQAAKANLSKALPVLLRELAAFVVRAESAKTVVRSLGKALPKTAQQQLPRLLGHARRAAQHDADWDQVVAISQALLKTKLAPQDKVRTLLRLAYAQARLNDHEQAARTYWEAARALLDRAGLAPAARAKLLGELFLEIKLESPALHAMALKLRTTRPLVGVALYYRVLATLGPKLPQEASNAVFISQYASDLAYLLAGRALEVADELLPKPRKRRAKKRKKGKKGKARVFMSRSYVVGGLDAASIRRVVRRSHGAWQACMVEAVTRNPKTAGAVKMYFVIKNSGELGKVVAESNATGDKRLARCLVAGFKRLRFYAADGNIVNHVKFPLRLKPRR